MNRKNEENRELTAAEEARKIKFEKIKEQLISDGYKENNLTIGVVDANVMALVLSAPFVVLFAALFLVLNIDRLSEIIADISEQMIFYVVIFIVSLFVLTVVHELIHGITWSFFTSKGWKAISFGFIAKYMTPYCSCNEALKKGQYLTGVLMPTVILGIIPLIISVISGSVLLFAVGALMVVAGGGDLTIALKVLKFNSKGKEVLYMDHPYQVGLVAFEKIN